MSSSSAARVARSSPAGSPWQYGGKGMRSPMLSPIGGGLKTRDERGHLDGFTLEAAEGEEGKVGLETILSTFRRDSKLNLFLSDDFDAVKHVGMAIRDGTVTRSLNETEVAANLISAHVREEVTRRQEALLGEVEAVSELEQQIQVLSDGLEGLGETTDALVDALDKPYLRLKKAVTKLRNVTASSVLLQKVSRFQSCSRKLRDFFQQGSKADAEYLVSTAEAVHELEEVMLATILERVDVTSRELPSARKSVSEFKTRVTEVLRNGLAKDDQSSVGAALQSLAVLRILPERITAEVNRLLTGAQAAIMDGFDTKQMLPKSGTDPTTRSPPQEIWHRIDHAINYLHDISAQSIKLQIMLQRKHDAETYEPLSFAVKSNPSGVFLQSMSKSLLDQFQSLARAKQRTPGALLFDALCDEYPRLLAKFSDLSKRLYSTASLSTVDGVSAAAIVDREEVQRSLIHALSPIEKRYLTISLSRVTDPIMSLFSSGPPPGEVAAAGVAKLFAAELASTKAEARLFEQSQKNVAAALYMYYAKSQELVASVTGQEAVDLYNGLSVLSSSAQIAFGLQIGLGEEITEATNALVALSETVLKKPFKDMTETLESIIQQMHDEYLERDRLSSEKKADHKVEFAKAFSERMRTYRVEFCDLLIRSRALSNLCRDLARRCLDSFVRHASLIWSLNKDLLERIAKDMSEFESSVTALCSIKELGTSFSTFRAFRRLVTMEIAELETVSDDLKELLYEIPPSVFSLHVLGRADAPLIQPHRRLQWTNKQMCDWLQTESEDDAWKLVVGSLDAYEKVRMSIDPDENRFMCAEYKVLRSLGPDLLDAYHHRTNTRATSNEAQ